MSVVQEERDQNERIRKVRVEVDDLKRRALIRMADTRDLQEQMRRITMRLGSCVMKVGEDDLNGEKPE